MHTRVLVEKGENSPSFASDDRIFLGEGLFETIKVSVSKPCFSELHWDRMSRSAKSLGIHFELSFDDWQEHIIQQIKKDNIYHGGIKVILSGGSAPRGLAEFGQVSQVLLQTFNYTITDTPIRLQRASWLRDANNAVYQYKSVNYLEAIIARRQALTQSADDALFFNTSLYATESTCANLFIIKNNELMTPMLTDGVLGGVTRSRILAYCAKHSISCLEKSISNEMLLAADFVFLCNSLQGLRRVSSFNGFSFPLENALYQKLLSVLPTE